jgi:hypothetical protein
MKFKKWTSICLLVSIANICMAAHDTTTIQQAMGVRLGRLQNLIVKYEHTRTTSLPSAVKKKIQENSEKESLVSRRLLGTGTLTTEKEFSFLHGRIRYDSRLKERKLDVEPPSTFRDHELQIVSYPGGRVERLWRTEGSNFYFGLIGQDKKPNLQNDIEVGLGMKPWGQDVWLNSENLEKMEIVLPDANLAIMTNVDEKGRINEWTFDRKFGYALTSYRKRVPPDLHIAIEITAGKFKNVDTLMLPFSIISRTLFWENDKPEVVMEIRIEAHEYKLNDPNNVPERYHIKWPDNSFVSDERTGFIFSPTDKKSK